MRALAGSLAALALFGAATAAPATATNASFTLTAGALSISAHSSRATVSDDRGGAASWTQTVTVDRSHPAATWMPNITWLTPACVALGVERATITRSVA